MTRAPQKTAFIDRDGTLIEEVNFLSRVEDLRIFEYTRKALESLKDSGFLTIVVTNQSGIARALYDEAAMHAIHREMDRQLPGLIDQYYYCRHLPNDGCDCRKPRQGMIQAACSDFHVDLGSSWMIGDKAIDIETGWNAGTYTALVMTGYGRTAAQKLERRPDVSAEDLFDAVRQIVSR
jgi:D-glycero-D-manno-heptose 1,7-bisphosphate phosphatase